MIPEKYITKVNTQLSSDRSIVFIGMMGAGKSTIGRKIAFKLQRDFIDTDIEIEKSAQLSISEIFSLYGEDRFRTLEQQVICRLLEEKTGVISVGGGAFMNETLRKAIENNGISIWLKADFNTLMSRVHRHDHRPLLEQDEPENIMKKLIEERYPIYEKSDITIYNNDDNADETSLKVFKSLVSYLDAE